MGQLPADTHTVSAEDNQAVAGSQVVEEVLSGPSQCRRCLSGIGTCCQFAVSETRRYLIHSQNPIHGNVQNCELWWP